MRPLILMLIALLLLAALPKVPAANAQLPPGAEPVSGATPAPLQPGATPPAATPPPAAVQQVAGTLAPELVGVWEQRTKSGPYDIVMTDDIAPSGHYTLSLALPGQPPQKMAESGTVEAKDGHYKTTGDDSHMVQTGDYSLKDDTLVLAGPPASTWKRASHQSKQAPPGEGTTPVGVTLTAPADQTAVGWIAAARPIAKAWHHDAELVAFTGKTVDASGKVDVAGVGKDGSQIDFLSPSTRTVMTLIPMDGQPTAIMCRAVVDNEAYTFGVPDNVADLTDAVNLARKDGYTPAVTQAVLSVWTDKDHRPTRCAWVLYNSGDQDIRPYCYDAVHKERIPYMELFGEEEKYQASINKQIDEMVDRMQHGGDSGAMGRWQKHGDLINIPCGSEKLLCVRVPVTINGMTVNMLIPSKPLTADQLRDTANYQQMMITPTPGVAFVEAGGWVPDTEAVAAELARLYDQ
jgi:hypothetical protein